MLSHRALEAGNCYSCKSFVLKLETRWNLPIASFPPFPQPKSLASFAKAFAKFQEHLSTPGMSLRSRGRMCRRWWKLHKANPTGPPPQEVSCHFCRAPGLLQLIQLPRLYRHGFQNCILGYFCCCLEPHSKHPRLSLLANSFVKLKFVILSTRAPLKQKDLDIVRQLGFLAHAKDLGSNRGLGWNGSWLLCVSLLPLETPGLGTSAEPVCPGLTL